MTAPARAGRREWIGLAVLALPCMLVVMDLTVLFLAVPKLTAALQPSATELLWITDAYGFLIAGSLIVMGTLGDRIGRRRVLLTGGAGFAGASALAAFAPSPELLIAARALQGIAGATLVPSTMAMVFTMFADEQQRRTALAIVMSCFAAGAALGPLVGGALLSFFWWGSVFLVNLPVMAVLLAVGPRLLPEFKHPGARLDAVSAALALVAVLGAIAAVKQGVEHGLDWPAAACGALGAAAGAAFVRRQGRLEHPLVEPALFRIRAFSTALVLNVAGAFVMYGMFLFTSQYLQLSAGLSPLAAGACGLPGIAALVIVSNLVPWIVRRVPPAFVIASGLAVAAVGFAMLTQLRPRDGVQLIIAAEIVMSMGIAPLTVLATELIVGAAPAEQSGAAAGVAHTGNELGGALGIALLGSLGAAIYRSEMDAGAPGTFGEAVAGGLPAAVLDAAHAAFTDAVQAAAAANSLIALAAAGAVAILLRHHHRKDAACPSTP